MKPIIVAIDFSNPSLNAAYYAADLAKSLNTDIILIHVIELPVTASHVSRTKMEFDALEHSAHSNIENLQRKLIDRTRNKIKVHAKVEYGTVNFEIEKFAREKNPFAIVVGIKSHATARRFFLGSNALRFIHHSIFPILLIPENASFQKIKNIAIASDLISHENDISVLHTKQWLNALHVPPSIIHVKTKSETEEWINAGIKDLQNIFTEFSPKYCFINEKEVAEGINTFVNDDKTDLLIVTPEKHGLLEPLLIKSNSKEIILHSQIPVLSIFSGSASKSKNSESENSHSHHHSCRKCTGNCEKRMNPKSTIDETHLTA
ncbi:MAG TPA: universal stress protein [Puia sp.]|nr:universal stress protein [Puia sp.]